MANPTRPIPQSELPRPDAAPSRGDGGDPLSLVAFQRHIEGLRWRLDDFRPDPDAGQAEVFEALETTLEELGVAVEELRSTNDALHASRAEVEASQRRYRDLFDQAPDPYLVTDPKGNIREANLAASVALNIAHRFLLGKPLVVFLPEEGRQTFRAELARLATSTGSGQYELRFQPRRLAPFDAAVRVGPVHDDRGHLDGLRWTVRDVSAQRRAEAKIRALHAELERRVVERSEQLEDSLQANERLLIKAHAADAADAAARPEGRLFQDLVEEVNAILWRADAETGRYTFVSRRAEDLLGYPVGSWLEGPDAWLARVHPEDRDHAAAQRRKQLREGVGFEAEYRAIAADGRVLWFREIIRSARPEPDGPAVLCGLMVNITRRKKVERQLHYAKAELVTELRDMTYLHELGGRLATARTWRETLDEVLGAVASLLGAEMAMVLLREPDSDLLRLAGSLGLAEEFARMAGRGPLDPGRLGLAPASRQLVVVEDVEAGAVNLGVRQAARVGGFRALLGVPLFSRDGEFLGALAAFFPAPYRPPARQARLVEMYADQAAEAIEAARLRRRSEEAGARDRDAAARMKGPLDAILRAAADPGLDPAAARALIRGHARSLLGLVDGLAGPPDADPGPESPPVNESLAGQ